MPLTVGKAPGTWLSFRCYNIVVRVVILIVAISLSRDIIAIIAITTILSNGSDRRRWCEVCKMNVPHRVMTPDDPLKSMAKTLDCNTSKLDHSVDSCSMGSHSHSFPDVSLSGTGGWMDCSAIMADIDSRPSRDFLRVFGIVNERKKTRKQYSVLIINKRLALTSGQRHEDQNTCIDTALCPAPECALILIAATEAKTWDNKGHQIEPPSIAACGVFYVVDPLGIIDIPYPQEGDLGPSGPPCRQARAPVLGSNPRRKGPADLRAGSVSTNAPPPSPLTPVEKRWCGRLVREYMNILM
ncbi:hypothetical protein PoB_001673600 [Plakobranchus ocellatus]|uniref:Uncharacterized protein n=1 Tax=Plakobranchus ocellatus TaxID=259542 RepID=A0AAV3YSZ9_9GAST|nr:hypothetical protein PoB_001673600 [Plakobranchus ocellatus]